MAATAACILLIVSGGTSRGSRIAQPIPVTDSAGGIELSLRDATPSAAEPSAPAQSRELSAAQADALLALLPPLPTEPALSDATKLPPASLPPPRAGVTIVEPFPATTTSTPPAPVVRDEPLRMIRHAPEGDVEIAPGVTLVFSQPMVPLASVGALAGAAIPATLTPQPSGRWRWLDTSTLVFEGDGGRRLPAATRYEVNVPAGTRSATGNALADAVRFTFATRAPRVESFTPWNVTTDLAPPIGLAFDSRVDPQAVLASLTLTADGRPHAVELADPSTLGDRLAGHRPENVVALRVASPLPPSTDVTVTLAKGAFSAEGPLATAKEQSFAFVTRGPLALETSRCGWDGECRPNQHWRLIFTNPLDPGQDTDSVASVTPTLPGMSIQIADKELWISGDMEPRTSYQVRVSPRLTDAFGQHPPREIRATFDVGGREPMLSVPGAPFIVVPASGPAQLSVLSAGQSTLRLRAWRVTPAQWDVVGAAQRRAQERGTGALEVPGVTPIERVLEVRGRVDDLTETRVALRELLDADTGHLVISVEPAKGGTDASTLTWVQVTGLGLDAVIDSERVVAWATDLATGAPIAGVPVTLAPDGVTRSTNDDGLASFEIAHGDAPPRALVARRGDDVAFLPESPWWGWDGQRSSWPPWQHEARLVAHVLDDRGVYRPGETAHVRGWLRRVDSTLAGVTLAKGGPLAWTLFDSQRNELARGTTPLSATSAFALEVALPDGMNLGFASLELRLGDGEAFGHPLRVEEFRRPEYEVRVEAGAGPHVIGDTARLTATASYYSGGGLPDSEVTWNIVSREADFHPPGWPAFHFGRWREWWLGHERAFRRWPGGRGVEDTWSHVGRTDASGVHALDVTFDEVDPPGPTSIEAEATIQDVNRQAWSARTTLLVHSSALQVGVRLPRPFLERGDELPVELIVTDLDGKALADRAIAVRATRSAWKQVKGAWTEVEEDAVECGAMSGTAPVSCALRLEKAGRWTVRARVTDEKGRANESTLAAWVTGAEILPDRGLTEGTAELIPEKEELAVGDVARVLLRSPFAPAEALLTIEHGRILEQRRIPLDDPSTILEIPIREGHEPVVVAKVLLTGEKGGRPAFARGSIRLVVPPKRHELEVTATPAAATLAPGDRTSIDLAVTDAQGQPATGEVTVIVADEAVLALTGYELVDPLATFFPEIGEVTNDLRSRSHVVIAGPELVAQADDIQIGGGTSGTIGYSMEKSLRAEPMMAPAPAPPGSPDSPVALRTDLRALALFEPAVQLDAAGRARVELKIPDSLTRWRVMAIASSGATRFGRAESSITARKPLMLRPSPPRFLNVGDRSSLPIVVQNGLDEAVTAHVAVRVTGAQLVGPAGEAARVAAREVVIPARDRAEVRFDVAATRPGTVRLQAIASAAGATDATELAWPTWTPATTEAFAVHGVVDEGAIAQPVTVPSDALPDYGGLELTTTSTALAELGDAMLYLREYPFACSEQLASRVLGVSALRDVVRAFSGIPNEAEVDAALARDVKLLLDRQREDGSFGFWRREPEPHEWPYVSVHATHALVRAKAKGVPVDERALAKALEFTRGITFGRLEKHGNRAARATMAAYALHARRLAGDPAPQAASDLVRELGNDLPLEALAWVLPIVPAAERPALTQRLLNHVVETPGAASFATTTSELGDDAYLVLHSSRRLDAIALEALLEVPGSSSRSGEEVPGTLSPKLVRGLLDHRVAGRWDNTQENCFALLALDRYFRAHESRAPDFDATAWLGGSVLQQAAFHGRSTERHETHVPLAALPNGASTVTVAKYGPGRLYYRLGLRYAPRDVLLPPAEQGFRVERLFESVTDPADVRRDADGTWRVKAGALIRLRVRVANASRRTHVAVVDPLPAGLEMVNAGLETSQRIVEPEDARVSKGFAASRPAPPWFQGWAEHENLRDDRAESFASLLAEGEHEQVILCRATTPGHFISPPARAEEMYSPEVFGRSGTDVVIVE